MSKEKNDGGIQSEVARKISKQIRRKKKRSKIKSAAVKSIAVATVACILVVSTLLIYKNRDLFNPRNLEDTLSNAEGGVTAKIGGAIDVITGNTAEYVSYADGIAVVTTNSVRYATMSGKDSFILDAEFNSPAVSAAGGWLLAYDKSGKALFVTNTSGKNTSGDGFGENLSAHINKNGYISVFSEAEGYKCALSVYDDGLNLRYRWKTTEYYGIASAVSNDGKTCAAAVVKPENGALVCKIIILDISKEGVKAEADLGEVIPTDIWETESGFLALADGCAAAVDSDGSITEKTDFGASKMSGYSRDGLGGVFAVLNKGDITARYELLHIDSSARVAASEYLDSDVDSISAANGLLAVLTGSGINVYDSGFNLKRLITPDGEVKKIIIIADGTVVMVTSDEVLTA